METTKRERIILYGVVPIVAAVVGAVMTVIVGRYIGGDKPSEVLVEILKAPGLSPADKAKLMALANESTTRFYDFLKNVLSILSMVAAFLGVSVASRIARGGNRAP